MESARHQPAAAGQDRGATERGARVRACGSRNNTYAGACCFRSCRLLRSMWRHPPLTTSRHPLYSTLYRLSTNTDGFLLHNTGASKTTITKFLVLYEIYSPFCLPFYFTVFARFSVVTIYLDPCCYFSSFLSHICYAVGQCFYPGAVKGLTHTLLINPRSHVCSRSRFHTHKPIEFITA